MARYGGMVKQLLELLGTGMMLGFARDKSLRRKLLVDSDKIWFTLDRKRLYRGLEGLKLQSMVESIRKMGDIEEIKLTNKGKVRALEYKFYHLKLEKRRRWDRRWRLVLFDVPEPKKKIRDALRKKLKNLGFLEFQKSVFVFPYPCEDEINFVINFFNIPENVYYLEAPIKPDGELRKHFKL